MPRAQKLSVREKILDRLKKILLRAKSPNPHEADLARALADEFIQKHAITQEEVDDLFRPEPSRRSGGIIQNRWQETLAFEIGKIHHCRALRAEERVVFEGVDAVEAAVRYRTLQHAIEEAKDEWIGSQAKVFHSIWTEIFCGEIVLSSLHPETERPKNTTHTLSQDEIVDCARAVSGSVGAHNALYCIELCIREANTTGRQVGLRLARGEIVRGSGLSGKTFSRSGDLLLVSDHHPGNYATLFQGEQKLPFRGDISAFDDARKTYTWVFGQAGQLLDGLALVFATSDRVIVGEVRGSEIWRSSKTARIARSPEGEPAHVERIESP